MITSQVSALRFPALQAPVCIPPARAHAEHRTVAAAHDRCSFTRSRRSGVASSSSLVCSRKHVGRTLAASSSVNVSAAAESAEAELLSVLREVRGRGAGATPPQEQAILKAIYDLEADGGLPQPVDLPEIEGDWNLLYTSKSKFDPRNPLGSRVDGTAPGIEGFFTALFGKKPEPSSSVPALQASSSPIQRTITGNDAFTVTQDVDLRGANPHVDNVVDFGDVAVLRLTAEASIPPGGDRRRVNFAFDGGYVQFKAVPVKIPYPVPFKLLGDEAKGWLDTTYLSSTIRISRGNKGTTFVLSRR